MNSSSEAASATLGASLTTVLASFEDRTAALRDLLTLRTLGPDSFPMLERTEMLLTALEGDVSSVRGAIVSESALLTEAQQLLHRAQRCGAEISAAEAAAPSLVLPGDMEAEAAAPHGSGGAAARPPLQELDAEAAAANSVGGAANPPPPPPPPPRTPASSSAGGNHSNASSARRPAASSSARAPPPQLALVTEAELESAPSYMRSRLDVTKVNASLMEVQAVLKAKYSLLHTPQAQVRTLPEAERKRHAQHKALESEATRGLYFFSEDDLKAGVPSIRNDATGKNMLAVLRHTGRIKEFKHSGGMRCWHVR